MTAMEAAVEAWREALGRDKVGDSDVIRQSFARTALPESRMPRCVLRPTNQGDVQTIVAIARAHAHPLYPVSGGKNWGYGSACAPEEGAAVVDLSGMNRILEIDEEMGYAVIEPGVTQQQLYEAVKEAAPDFWVDVTGAGPDATIVGNAMERGFGHTPYADHVRSTCGMTVVLPDGRILETGFGHFPKSKARHLYPYGVGPMLDGLFSQSNLGIVTRIGVWLCPRPEAFSFFYIKVPDESRLCDTVEALRPLRMKGLLNSAVHIGNDLRVFTSLDTYPWEATGGETPLPPAIRTAMREDAKLGAWNVTGSLTGTRAQVREARRRMKKTCGHLGDVIFVDDRKLALGKGVAGLLARFGLGKALVKNLSALVPNYGLLQGIPTRMPLQSLAWRLRKPLTEALVDPLESNVGLIWLAPVLPLRGGDAEAIVQLVTPLFHAHGFDLPVTLTMLNERAMVAVFNISFDKTVEEEAVRAAACYEAVTTTLLEHGYVPYRSSLMGMGHLVTPGDTFWEVARDIKATLDPARILAPGRYIP